MAKTVAVHEGVWWVGCGSWGGVTEPLSDEGDGNVFLAGGDGDFALIDAGGGDGADAIGANAASVGAAPGDIKTIVLTHSHHDHSGGVWPLRAATGAKLAASALVAEAFAGDAALRERLYIRHDHRIDIETVLDEGDEIRLGPYAFRVMLTPGHIPDAVTLVGEIAGAKVLFTGDTAIGDQAGFKGVHGWLDGHWGSAPRQLLRSIQRIAACEADLMLGGHGRPIVGAGNVAASLGHCCDRLQQLLAIEGLGSMMPLDLSD